MKVTDVFSNLKKFLLPHCSFDQRLKARWILGMINYAQLKSWWGLKILQQLVKSRLFNLHINRADLSVIISGAEPSHVWVCDEVFTEQVYDLSLPSFTPEIIIDLGANIGAFSLLASKKWPGTQFITVEPASDTFSVLLENLKLNHITATTMRVAAGKPNSVVRLNDCDAVLRSTHISPFHPEGVLCLGMNSFIPEGVERLLLKIDIEGAEIDLLSSMDMALPSQCFIFIELHDGDASVTFIEEWAKDWGFQYHETRRRGNAIDGYLVRTIIETCNS